MVSFTTRTRRGERSIMLLTSVHSYQSRAVAAWQERRAFTDELRAGEHEQRTTSVTALQDWLSNSPVDPRSLKVLICDALKGLTGDESASVQDPPLILRRGVERC
jgi:hypothetical protein